jgi:hypothetical protein
VLPKKKKTKVTPIFTQHLSIKFTVFSGSHLWHHKTNVMEHWSQITILGIIMKYFKNNQNVAGHWWLMSIIVATQEAEIRRIVV